MSTLWIWRVHVITAQGDRQLVRDLVDEIITVDEAEIADATKLVWGRMKLCIEPSAGAGVAVIEGSIWTVSSSTSSPSSPTT